MDKKKYTQAYRLSRMLHQCHIDNDRKGKRVIREVMKQCGIDHIDYLWAERSRIDGIHQEFKCVYGSRVFGYNSEHTPERNWMILVNQFKRILNETYH